MTAKKTMQDARKDFFDMGYCILDEVYINSKSCMTIVDNLGYKYYVNYNSLRNIQKTKGSFKKFQQGNPYTIYNIKNFLKLSGTKTTLLSKEYVNSTSKMTWKCGQCGSIFKKSLIKIEIGSKLCQECGNKSVSNHRKLEISEKEKILKKNNLTTNANLEETKLIDSITFTTKEGYKFESSLLNVSLTNGGYNFIGKGNPYSLHNINLYLQLNNIKTRAIDFTSAKENVLFECGCGEKFGRIWFVVKNSKENVCPKCTQKIYGSSYSKAVESWLKENKIDYEVEKTFDSCKNKALLPFDFYIKEKDLLIEVDGEQHFKPINFGGISKERAIVNFEDTIKRDKIKTEWCKKHSKKLLRISYKEIKNLSYIEKLEKNIKLN